jgi:phage FluMu protein Com
MVKCKCGNMIEVVEGKLYLDYKKDDGKLINKTAAKHMSQYRVRCPECQINFCSSCNEEPYHIGKTCQ